MSYELSLAPDPDRGGHRYRAEVSPDGGAESIGKLSDWLVDAAANPDAHFELDLTALGSLGPGEQEALNSLLARHVELLDERRLSVVRVPPPAPRAVKPTTLERAIIAVGSGGGPA